MASQEQRRTPERVVIVGGGFSGFFAARRISRKLTARQAQVTLITDLDALLYQPLLPEVAVGALDPRSIAVPLATALKRVHLVRGRAAKLDTDQQTVTVNSAGGRERLVQYDRLLITAGSVSRLPGIPGLAEYSVGFKTAAEALYLRDLVLRRMEVADSETDSYRRQQLLTFFVVGAGYAGTELVAQMSHMTHRLAARFPGIKTDDLRWMLLDVGEKVMPELGQSLGDHALGVLRERGVHVRMGSSVESITESGVHLTNGSFILGATVVWCAGVSPSPIVAATGLPTTRGRLTVDAELRVAGHSNIYAAGDAAAVPDLSKPAAEDGSRLLCPPTAQHAMRQGSAVARNIVADIRGRPRRPYRHRDLGLVVDLGGPKAVARPLGVPLHGRPAKLITRSYHVYALPSSRRRMRVLTDWILAGRRPDDVSLGILPLTSALARAEHPIENDAHKP
jgi:NADH:ubiquinone reductase (H+-translocating)